MIEIICFIFLALVLFAMCLTLATEGKTSTKAGGGYLIAIFAIFVVFSFFFEPKEFIRWDLIEHFRVLDEMREGGIKYVVYESIYKDLYVYNYFAYFISLLPENLNNLLTTIPLIIDFAIVGYIYRKMFKTYLPETDGKVRILAILMWLCTFGMKLVISGIRCSFAVSLVALAIYLLMTKKKNKVLSIVMAVLLCVVAIFVHNFALVVILVWLASKISKPILTMLIALGIGLAIEPISRFVVRTTSSGYLRFSFNRILETLEARSFSTALNEFDLGLLLVYFCFIALSIYLFVISLKAKEENKEKGYKKTIANFTATVGAVAIGLSFNHLYLERFMYLVSYAYLMIIPIYNSRKKSISWENIIVLPVAFYTLFFNDIYTFMVNFVENYFFAF